MPRIMLPPDAFEDMPEGYCWSSDPDDGRDDNRDFPEYMDYLDREIAERRYDAEERFAAVLNDAERIGGAA